MMTTDTRTAETVTGIRRFIPILFWLPRYDRSWLTVDIIAGLTLWGLVVPEAMAYAGVAGLPPQMGLYTLLAALLVYALLGTSRHLVVQATSATAAFTDEASATFTFAAYASAAPIAFSWSARAGASATSQAATFAPSFANLRAVASPIPAAAPVTTTTRPESPVSMLMTEPLLPRPFGPR